MKEVLRKIVIILMVMMLVINSSAILVISEAVDEIQSLTNNKNVRFMVYFKDENGNKKAQINQKINSEDQKLYFEITVENDGYLENAEVTLNNSNFIFDTTNEIEGISELNTQSLKIDYIGAGETRKIELKVKANKQEEYKIEELEKETTVELKGTYVNSKSSNIEIKAERQVQWKQTSPYDEENKGITLSQEIITNKVMKYNGEEKRIVQEEIKNGLEGNGYPIKETEIEIQAAKVNKKNPEKVIVNIVEKNLTTEKEIEEGDYEYNKETGKVVIKRENKANEENQVEWKQEGEDKYIVTYVYEETEEVEEQEIEAKAKMVLYDEKGTEIEAEDKVQTEKAEKDGTVRLEIENQENQIYKGKIYADGERKITENVKINVNSIGTSESIEIAEEEKEELNSGKITINKKEEKEILGQEGTITITNAKTGEKIAEINKETEAEENGEVGIELNNVKAIKVKTSKPQKVGRINIEIEKTIKESNQKEIQNKQEIKYGITGKYTNEKEEEIEKAEATIELKETTTEATMEISKNTLNTIEENEIEIKATLKEDTERNDLYKNPKIEIELPKQVEEAEITNINKMYAENFNISSSKIEEKNGRKVIEISLKGEDKTYVEDIIGGPTVIIDLKIKLNKTAKTETEKITMKYTNEKARRYEKGETEGQEEKEIEIKSPTGIITTNKIEELKVKTVGEEEKQNVKIEVGKEEKEAGIEKEIINNTGAKVENVVITGRLATNGKENNMGIKMTEGINVEGVDGATVYYTEKEKVTTEVEDSSNEWKTEITDSSKVKNYMVKIAKMEETETAKIEYKEVIPQSLEYNQDAVETYEVEYTDTTTSTSQEVKGTTVEMSTGTGPELNVTLTAEVGGEQVEDNSNVRQGEVIRYTAKVTNVGTETATNVTINGLIPEGTVYVEPKNNYQHAGATYYDEKDEIKQYTTSENSILAQECKIYTYEVRVKNNSTPNTKMTNKITATYNSIKKESNQVVNNTIEEKLRVTVKQMTDGGPNLSANSSMRIATIIENLSEQEIKNVKINLRNTDNINIISITDENIQEIESKDNIVIDSIPANSYKVVFEYISLNNANAEKKSDIRISSSAEYNSNIIRSNEINITGYNYILNMKQTSEQELKELKAGEEVEYKFTINNMSLIDAASAKFYDEISSNLTILQIKFNDEIISQYDINKETNENNKEINRNISIYKNLKANSENTVTIRAIVNGSNENIKKEVSNKASISINGSEIAVSNEIKIIVNYTKNSSSDSDKPSKPDDSDKPSKPDDSDKPSKPDDSDKPNKPDDSDSPDIPNTNTYSIGGFVWIDSDGNGMQDDNEEKISDIKVKLYDLNNKKIVQNANGEDLIVQTSSDGSYVFDNIKPGKYIAIFEYDESTYKLTKYKVDGTQESKNSKVLRKELNINGTISECATTDTITITDRGVYNINMGLIKISTLNVKIQKSIDKVIVQNADGTTVNQYNSADLAKAEINAKKLNGTIVITEYSIVVTNDGEAAAYIRKIEDKMPKDMMFKAELNKDWYQSGGNLYSTSMANEKLNAGESKTLKLILTKEMNSSNTGLINNIASISEIYNEQGLTEKNTEDNQDNAKLIISIKTGEFIKYSVIIIAIFAILLVGGYLIINKNLIRKEEEDEENN